jgi:S-adenosylmethionine-diacylgycerolhomoserine-N-methlytransferase
VTIVSEADTTAGATAQAPWPNDATHRMNRMYRWQRFIYDATRRYYLLGRDQLIVDLKPTAGAQVLEIGCGTGRNLVQAARRYPAAQFTGIDISTEMLTTALGAIKRHGLDGRIRVAHGDATDFDPMKIFSIAPDHIVVSYALSMIPDWQGVLNEAVNRLKPGGQLHIVDFGDQERLPGSMRRVLQHWLLLFDVTPRKELQNALVTLAEQHQAQLDFKRPFRGYSQSAVLTLKA